MESPKFLKKTLFAGLLLAGTEVVQAQDFDHWHIVTEKQWNHYDLPGTKIDTVDLKQQFLDGVKYTVDDTKLGRVVVDAAQNSYYWVNQKLLTDMLKEKEKKEAIVLQKDFLLESASEEIQFETLMTDPEMLESLEKFKSSCDIQYPYGILSCDIGEHLHPGDSVDLHGDIRSLNQATVVMFLKDKNVSISIPRSRELGEATNNFIVAYFCERFLTAGLRSAIRDMISLGKRRDNLSSFKEKKEFAINFFTNMLPQSLENFNGYVPPVIDKPTYQVMHPPTNSKSSISSAKPLTLPDEKKGLEQSKSKHLDIDEKTLDDLLRED